VPYADLAAQRYDVACLETGDYRAVAELVARYSDLGLGLADCSIAVLGRALRAPVPAQLRRAAFPDRCAASGWVIRDAACGFLETPRVGAYPRIFRRQSAGRSIMKARQISLIEGHGSSLTSPIAMQAVAGSNPISRFEEAPLRGSDQGMSLPIMIESR
jgi:hypothetical protein